MKEVRRQNATLSDTICNTKNWKKRSEETQTLRAGCSKAEPKIFAPPQIPFPGAQDGQYLISWRWSLPLPTNPVWWRSMHSISNYRGNRPTHKPTNVDRTDYNTLRRSLARSIIIRFNILPMNAHCCWLYQNPSSSLKNCKQQIY